MSPSLYLYMSRNTLWRNNKYCTSELTIRYKPQWEIWLWDDLACSSSIICWAPSKVQISLGSGLNRLAKRKNEHKRTIWLNKLAQKRRKSNNNQIRDKPSKVTFILWFHKTCTDIGWNTYPWFHKLTEGRKCWLLPRKIRHICANHAGDSCASRWSCDNFVPAQTKT